MSYQSECEGKVRHKDRASAKRAIRQTRHRDHEHRLNAYRCSWCDFWHAGRTDSNLLEHFRSLRAQTQGDQ